MFFLLLSTIAIYVVIWCPGSFHLLTFPCFKPSPQTCLPPFSGWEEKNGRCPWKVFVDKTGNAYLLLPTFYQLKFSHRATLIARDYGKRDLAMVSGRRRIRFLCACSQSMHICVCMCSYTFMHKYIGIYILIHLHVQEKKRLSLAEANRTSEQPRSL